MKTNLAYIEGQVPSRMEVAKTSTRMRTVGGFQIPVSEPNHQALGFSEKRESLVKSLAEIGVTPLAVLPSSWWMKMAKEAGLVTFWPHESSKMNFNASGFLEKTGITDASVRGRVVVGGIMVGVLAINVAAFSAAAAFGGLGSATWMDLLMGVTGFSGVGGILGLIGQGIFHGRLYRAEARRMSRRAIRKMGMAELMRRFMGQPEWRNDDLSMPNVGFTLPDPDKASAEVISRLVDKGQKFSVSCEPEAFLFSEPLDRLAANRLVREKEERKERERQRLLADPIVFVERNGVTAIVAQYGAFPLEKELVDRVMASPI